MLEAVYAHGTKDQLLHRSRRCGRSDARRRAVLGGLLVSRSGWNTAERRRPRLIFISPRFLFPAHSGGAIRTGQILRGMKGGRFRSSCCLSGSAGVASAIIATNCPAVADEWEFWPAAELGRSLAPVEGAPSPGSAADCCRRRPLARRPRALIAQCVQAKPAVVVRTSFTPPSCCRRSASCPPSSSPTTVRRKSTSATRNRRTVAGLGLSGGARRPRCDVSSPTFCAGDRGHRGRRARCSAIRTRLRGHAYPDDPDGRGPRRLSLGSAEGTGARRIRGEHGRTRQH